MGHGTSKDILGRENHERREKTGKAEGSSAGVSAERTAYSAQSTNGMYTAGARVAACRVLNAGTQVGGSGKARVSYRHMTRDVL